MSMKCSGDSFIYRITEYIALLMRALTIENIRWYVLFTILHVLEVYQWLAMHWYFPLFGVLWIWCGGPVSWAINMIIGLLILMSRATVGRKDLSYAFVSRTTGLFAFWGCIVYLFSWIGSLISVPMWARLLLLIFHRILFAASLPCVVVGLWILDGKLQVQSLLQSMKGAAQMIVRVYPLILCVHGAAWIIMILLTKIFNLMFSAEGSWYGAVLIVLPWYISGISQWYIMTRYRD